MSDLRQRVLMLWGQGLEPEVRMILELRTQGLGGDWRQRSRARGEKEPWTSGRGTLLFASEA